jgi:aquaporin rerated protein, other eukaryote
MVLFMGFAAAHIANLSGATDEFAPAVSTSNLMFIAVAFGLSLVINAWIFFRVSGALFNPAVSLGLALTGMVPPLRAAILSFAQVLGAITAAGLIKVLAPGDLKVATRLGPDVSVAQGIFLFHLEIVLTAVTGFFIEMFLTFQLMLMIFMLGVEKHKATFLAPVAIGLTLFVCHVAGIYFTGSSLNPARSFGPDLVTMSFPDYHWIYCTISPVGRQGD